MWRVRYHLTIMFFHLNVKYSFVWNLMMIQTYSLTHSPCATVIFSQSADSLLILPDSTTAKMVTNATRTVNPILAILVNQDPRWRSLREDWPLATAVFRPVQGTMCSAASVQLAMQHCCRCWLLPTVLLSSSDFFPQWVDNCMGKQLSDWYNLKYQGIWVRSEHRTLFAWWAKSIF